MKHSDQLDDLLTRSLFNGINPEEKAFLLQWLQASEANRQYYEDLKNTWQLMAVKKTPDDINIEEEWTHFKACVNNEAEREMPAMQHETTSAIFELEKKGRKKSMVYKWLIATTTAALVLIVLGKGLWWNNKKTSTPVVVTNAQKKLTPSFVTRRETNTSATAKQFVLTDGTIVLLDPLSEIQWQEPFADNRRDIHITGRAYFEVAKHKTKLFTVYSGDLATMALGTRFTVSAFVNKKQLSVRLYEGKVMVKAADSLQPKLKKAYFLLPGEELVYDNKWHTARVRTFTSAKSLAPENASDRNKNDEPVLPKEEKESWYMFNNQPLAQVFGQLQDLFGVEIVYSEKDVEKMYFIGRFSKKDSLSHILKQIAGLNNLTVTRENNKYVISQ
jgi:transmembrane sensor